MPKIKLSEINKEINNSNLDETIKLLQVIANNLDNENLKKIITISEEFKSTNSNNDDLIFFFENSIKSELQKIINELISEHGDKTFDIDKVENLHNEQILDELAVEMAFNHFTVSFGESKSDTEDTISNHVFNVDYKKNIDFPKMYEERKKIEKRRRNILLIGAGATHQSCPCIPFGHRLKNFLEQSNDEDCTYVISTSNIKKHPHIDTYENFNPEKYLDLIDRELPPSGKQKLRDVLHKVYNRRHLPTHSYDIIAHLFKHSFISVIINFNFDELLDQAIEDEMGNQKYIKILHDGDCTDTNFKNIFIDGRLKTPVYIKIHGTASYKSSLKFTQNHDFDMSSDMRNFINHWIGGHIPNPRKREIERIPVNLISIGFDMERFGFREQIRSANLVKGSKWFQINWEKPMLPIPISNTETLICKHIKLSKWVSTKPHLPPLADLLIRLYEHKVSPIFKESYSPKGIARHHIIPNLFYLAFDHGQHNDYDNYTKAQDKINDLTSYFKSTKYLFERTVVEVAMLIVRNKGIIEPREAAKEKVGYFYNKYKDLFIKNSSEAHINKKERINPNPDAKPYENHLHTMHDIYGIFKMQESYSFSSNLIDIAPFDKILDEWKEGDQTQILEKLCDTNQEAVAPANINDFENLHILVMYRLFKNAGKMFFLEKLKNLPTSRKYNWYEYITKNLKKIQNGYNYDIKPVFRDESMMHFDSIKRKHILHTNLSLSYHNFEFFIKNHEWDICLFISERGKFFSYKYFNQVNSEHRSNQDDFRHTFSDKLVVSISCQEAIAKDLQFNKPIESKKDLEKLIKQANDTYSFDVKMNYLILPYWRHHHHMVIFLKKSTSPSEGISTCFKIGENKFIHPVRSIYYFKQGFSNTINPISFPTECGSEKELEAANKDQRFLLSMYFAHYVKAIVYKNTGNLIPVLNPDLSYTFKYQEQKGKKTIKLEKRVTLDDFLNALWEKKLDDLIPQNLLF